MEKMKKNLYYASQMCLMVGIMPTKYLPLEMEKVMRIYLEVIIRLCVCVCVIYKMKRHEVKQNKRIKEEDKEKSN